MTKRFDFDQFDQNIRDAIIDDALAAGPIRPLWTNEGLDVVDNDGVPVRPPELDKPPPVPSQFNADFLAWLYDLNDDDDG